MLLAGLGLQLPLGLEPVLLVLAVFAAILDPDLVGPLGDLIAGDLHRLGGFRGLAPTGRNVVVVAPPDRVPLVGTVVLGVLF